MPSRYPNGIEADVTGNLTGNSAGTHTGPVVGNAQESVTLAAADGAIAVKQGVVVITKATAAALTLAAPTAGTDDGKILRIVSTTAAAHTVTNASPGFNGAGASGDVATFGAAIGNAMEVVAYNGVWLAANLTGVTLG